MNARKHLSQVVCSYYGTFKGCIFTSESANLDVWKYVTTALHGEHILLTITDADIKISEISKRTLGFVQQADDAKYTKSPLINLSMVDAVLINLCSRPAAENSKIEHLTVKQILQMDIVVLIMMKSMRTKTFSEHFGLLFGVFEEMCKVLEYWDAVNVASMDNLTLQGCLEALLQWNLATYEVDKRDKIDWKCAVVSAAGSQKLARDAAQHLIDVAVSVVSSAVRGSSGNIRCSAPSQKRGAVWPLRLLGDITEVVFMAISYGNYGDYEWKRAINRVATTDTDGTCDRYFMNLFYRTRNPRLVMEEIKVSAKGSLMITRPRVPSLSWSHGIMVTALGVIMGLDVADAERAPDGHPEFSTLMAASVIAAVGIGLMIVMWCIIQLANKIMASSVLMFVNSEEASSALRINAHTKVNTINLDGDAARQKHDGSFFYKLFTQRMLGSNVGYACIVISDRTYYAITNIDTRVINISSVDTDWSIVSATWLTSSVAAVQIIPAWLWYHEDTAQDLIDGIIPNALLTSAATFVIACYLAWLVSAQYRGRRQLNGSNSNITTQAVDHLAKIGKKVYSKNYLKQNVENYPRRDLIEYIVVNLCCSLGIKGISTDTYTPYNEMPAIAAEGVYDSPAADRDGRLASTSTATSDAPPHRYHDDNYPWRQDDASLFFHHRMQLVDDKASKLHTGLTNLSAAILAGDEYRPEKSEI